MKKIFIYILILIALSAAVYSCAGGYSVSYGVGFRGAYGPYGGYGYGGYGGYPNVRVGVYGGGYPRYGY